MNDIYDIFPKEIWITIILEIPCKYIPNLYDVSYKFKELCCKENIIERRKLYGYPRKIGHCKSYGVYNYKGNVYNNGNIIQDNGSLKMIMKRVRSNASIVKLVLNDLLDRLYEDNTNLIRGDLINFEIGDNSTFLFDGEKIIDTYVGNICALPKEFDIINDNVPIEYWRNTKFENLKFYFDIRIVKEQLINNIYYSNNRLEKNNTLFLLNDKRYIIMFPKKLSLLEIKEKLKNDNLSLFINSLFAADNNAFDCE